MIEYDVVWANTLEELIQSVNHKLSEGWMVAGGIAYDQDNLPVQAIYKKDAFQQKKYSSGGLEKTVQARTLDGLNKTIEQFVRNGWRTKGNSYEKNGMQYQLLVKE